MSEGAPANHFGGWRLAELVARTLCNGIGIWVAAWLLDGVDIEGGVVTVLLAGLILAAVAVWVRPIVTLLALPLIIITLGIGYVLVAMLGIALAAWILPDLTVDGFWSAFWAMLIIAVVNWLLGLVLGLPPGRARAQPVDSRMM